MAPLIAAISYVLLTLGGPQKSVAIYLGLSSVVKELIFRCTHTIYVYFSTHALKFE